MSNVDAPTFWDQLVPKMTSLVNLSEVTLDPLKDLLPKV